MISKIYYFVVKLHSDCMEAMAHKWPDSGSKKINNEFLRDNIIGPFIINNNLNCDKYLYLFRKRKSWDTQILIELTFDKMAVFTREHLQQTSNSYITSTTGNTVRHTRPNLTPCCFPYGVVTFKNIPDPYMVFQAFCLCHKSHFKPVRWWGTHFRLSEFLKLLFSKNCWCAICVHCIYK